MSVVGDVNPLLSSICIETSRVGEVPEAAVTWQYPTDPVISTALLSYDAPVAVVVAVVTGRSRTPAHIPSWAVWYSPLMRTRSVTLDVVVYWFSMESIRYAFDPAVCPRETVT